MQLKDFSFTLPASYIATSPIEPRDHAKLMVIHKDKKTIEHRHFYELPELLPPNTVLVRNSSKVVKARLLGKSTTGGNVELFFCEPRGKKGGLFLVKPGKKFPLGSCVEVSIGGETVQVQVRSVLPTGERELLFLTIEESLTAFLAKAGEVPLPPYMKQEHAEIFEKRYQTVYAKEEGSVAAPTAGLHFTEEVLHALEKKHIPIVDITLHVGLGTFLPVKVTDVTSHTMHSERYHITTATWEQLQQAKKDKKKIMAIGTTSTRTLEHVAKFPHALEGSTDIFIYPPYTFQMVDILLTNFHLPESTLLMLVSSFIGDREFTLHAYEEAKKHNYRFYSFGDAMLIL